MPKVAGLLLLLCLICSACGQTQTDSSAPADTTGGIDLIVTAFTADDSALAVTVKNNGTETSGCFYVIFYLDRGYDAYPSAKAEYGTTLAPGETTTVESDNDLFSTWGDGQYHAAVKVENASGDTETNEANNWGECAYYHGTCEAEYLELLPLYIPWAQTIMNKLYAQYGIATSETCNFRFSDYLDCDAGGMCGRVTLESERISVVSLNLSKYHRGYPDTTYKIGGVTYNSVSPEGIVQHEYVHAYHRAYVENNSSLANWDGIPEWFREGVADYISDQGEKNILQIIYAFKALGKQYYEIADIIADGLYAGEIHVKYDYAEDYMAMKYIVETYGFDKLAAIIRDNAYGTSLNTALVNNIGINYAELSNLVYFYVEDYVESHYDAVD